MSVVTGIPDDELANDENWTTCTDNLELDRWANLPDERRKLEQTLKETTCRLFARTARLTISSGLLAGIISALWLYGWWTIDIGRRVWGFSLLIEVSLRICVYFFLLDSFILVEQDERIRMSSEQNVLSMELQLDPFLTRRYPKSKILFFCLLLLCLDYICTFYLVGGLVLIIGVCRSFHGLSLTTHRDRFVCIITFLSIPAIQFHLVSLLKFTSLLDLSYQFLVVGCVVPFVLSRWKALCIWSLSLTPLFKSNDAYFSGMNGLIGFATFVRRIFFTTQINSPYILILESLCMSVYEIVGFIFPRKWNQIRLYVLWNMHGRPLDHWDRYVQLPMTENEQFILVVRWLTATSFEVSAIVYWGVAGVFYHQWALGDLMASRIFMMQLLNVCMQLTIEIFTHLIVGMYFSIDIPLALIKALDRSRPSFFLNQILMTIVNVGLCQSAYIIALLYKSDISLSAFAKLAHPDDCTFASTYCGREDEDVFFSGLIAWYRCPM
jgi:hypothetical protein